MLGSLIVTEQVPRINLSLDVRQGWCHTVGDDHIGLLLEGGQIMNYPRVIELIHLQYRLINNHRNALGLDALHDALDAGCAVVV